MKNEIEIGKRLEQFRKLLNMTHPEFAEYAGVSDSQIRNYQKGRQPVSETVKARLANGNQTIQDFLDGIEYVSIEDVEKSIGEETLASKFGEVNVRMLQYYSTDELLAELKRRIEAH